MVIGLSASDAPFALVALKVASQLRTWRTPSGYIFQLRDRSTTQGALQRD
jgi:hypothetical protein